MNEETLPVEETTPVEEKAADDVNPIDVGVAADTNTAEPLAADGEVA